MLSKRSSVVSILFILMLAAAFVFADDQLGNTQGGVAGVSALSVRGYIVKLEWISSGVAQVRMTVQSSPTPSLSQPYVFLVNSETKIDINGRIVGPKDLAKGDIVVVEYGQNGSSYVAYKVSVKRPGPGNVVKMNCRIEEIKTSASNFIFVMEPLNGSDYYYELIVTPESKLYRNGKLTPPYDFLPGDAGTVRFYMQDLKIITFMAISPHN